MLFRGLSFSVRAGELLEIHGANGSGKSRLLRLLAGITKDWSGKLEVAAASLYIGHDNGLHPDLTVMENVEWLASLCTAPSASIDAGLAAFGVRHLARQPCRKLSVGQQRRVALSRLVHDSSPLWLLDEPTGSLDARRVKGFRVLLARHLESGGAAVIATHATGAGNTGTTPLSGVSSRAARILRLGDER